MTVLKGCKECDGRKHVYNAKTGSWVRCRCIADRIKFIEYRRCGVPEVLFKKKLFALRDISRFRDVTIDLSPPVTETKIYWICADTTDRYRIVTTGYFLRAAIDAGLKAFRVSLAGLIDAQFKEGHAEKDYLLSQVRETEALVVDIDVAGEHKRLAPVLVDLFAVRSTRLGLTLFASYDDITNMAHKYGDELARRFRSKGVIRLEDSR